jgi:hypothetical protein
LSRHLVAAPHSRVRYQMEVIRANADLLDLDLGMDLADLPQLLHQKVVERGLEGPAAVLRTPDQVILLVVGPMGTQSDLPAPIISETWPAAPAQPAVGGFHPRADARGSQPQAG